MFIETTEDHLLDGRITLRQCRDSYRVAIDPVLLAAAVPARPGERVADLGCGVGAASLCLAARVPNVTIEGYEKETAFVELARTNVTANSMEGRVDIRHARIQDIGAAAFDHVMANPPYLPKGRSSPSPYPLRAKAMSESDGTLAEWVRAALAIVAASGTVTFIHRWDRCAELLAASSERSRLVLPIQAKQGREPHRVILRCFLGEAGRIDMRPPLVLHHADGSYTAPTQIVLRDGAALDLA
ncbi:MAG TPA: methyltransferase [Dongiaceae bacterium]|jgi:tRNA1(Val) A37 N6-methylase TrmN6|nr:methyltransferase [Dongiaceae bacterium]